MPAKIAKRNPMAIGNEPTDQELQLVMREVRDVVQARKKATKKWIREQLAQAVKETQARRST